MSDDKQNREVLAKRLLNREMPPDYRRERSETISHSEEQAAESTSRGLLVRCETEWLAVPVAALQELGRFGTVHPVPFRRNRAVAGVVNLRGRLTVAVDLGLLLGISTAPLVQHDCMVAFGRSRNRTVLLVSELGRMFEWFERNVEPVPATLAKASQRFCHGVVAVGKDRTAGILDPDILESALNRSLG